MAATLHLQCSRLSSRQQQRMPAATPLMRRPARLNAIKVSAVANPPPIFKIPGGKEAILCQKFQAHEATVSQALVLEDSDHGKQIVTSSLDKTIALWLSEGDCNDLCGAGYTQVSRLSPSGGPVFSMLLDQRSEDGGANQIFLGNHAKQILDWVPPRGELEAGVVLEGHCGWVRSLTSAGGRWLFSAACNQLKQWDMARAVPTAVSTTTLDKGDILALAATKERVYTAGADGSIHSFNIDKKGDLTVAATVAKAHTDRVTALALTDGLLFSTSYDGTVRAWDATTLEPALSIPEAHQGERVHCMVVGPDGLLYTGGGDKLVRRWWPEVLLEAASPLYCHNQSVRALAAGTKELLVSADKGGEVAVWKVTS